MAFENGLEISIFQTRVTDSSFIVKAVLAKLLRIYSQTPNSMVPWPAFAVQASGLTSLSYRNIF